MTTNTTERMTGRPWHGEGGVTLLETMMVMVIVAILLTLGIPGLLAFVQDARLVGQVNEMVASLNFARSEAVKRGIRVTVCPSADGQQCDDSTHWETGWIVFTDTNSNGGLDSADTILRLHEATAGSSTLHGSRIRLTYQSTGFSAGYNDTLRACDQRGTDFARSVVISNTGRVRVKSKADICP